MNFIKNTALALAAVSLLTISSPFAMAKDIYDMEETTTIAKGITQRNIKRLTSNGWQNINIIEADLSDGRFGVKTIYNTEDMTKLCNVKNLATSSSTLSAVNGDFFSWKGDDKTRGSAIGGMVSDGNLITSATSPWNFASVGKTKDGDFIFDYIDCTVSVTTPKGSVTINDINKYSDLSKPVIYTSDWGKLSPGSMGTKEEIVIEDGKVVSVNHDIGPVELKKDCYVITYLKDLSPEIPEIFAPGDEAVLEISYAPSFDNIEFAIGAGTLLLKDGKKAENTNDIAGYHPRTAIGVNEDSSKLYLVTVDGRQAFSKGVTISYLADLMAEIGAYNAANLDGGGSTTLVVKSPYTNEQTVANFPSDKSLRPVANGVGIVALKDGEEDGFITLETDSDYVFKGTSIFINAKLHDSNGTITDSGNLKWKATDGQISDGYYTPDSLGKQTVTVTCGNIKATKEITVLDKPVKIATGLKEYKIQKGDSAYITLTGVDEKGHKAYINLSDALVTLSSDILKLDGNKLTGAKKGSAVATFNMGDDVQTSAVIRVGGDTTSLVCPPDITIETNDKTIEDGFSFAVYGNTIKKNSLVERLVAKRLAGTLNKSELDTVLFLSDTSYIPNGFDKTVLSSSEYMIKNFGDTTIITMDNKKSPKWEELISALKSSSSKNIFIALSETINDDGGYYEEMLIDIMQKHLKNKNVYVLSPDGDLAIYDTGIKHIQTPGAESIKDISVVADHIGYLKITVLGDKFNIERVKIFE